MVWSRPTTKLFYLSYNLSPPNNELQQKAALLLLCQIFPVFHNVLGGSVAEWLAYWTQAQMGPGSNRSRDAVG